MPKQIYNNFSKGLAVYPGKVDRGGQYAEGRDLDIHRRFGYIMPGWLAAKLASSSDSPIQLKGMPIDLVVTAATGQPRVWMQDNAGRIYQLASGSIISTHYGSAMSTGHGITSGRIGSNTYIFHIYQNSIGVYGALESSPVFDDRWLSIGNTVTKPTGGATLTNANVQHPYLWWKSYLWIGDDYNLSKFDGQSGANGTWTQGAFQLPPDWEITALFGTKSYIGICAWRKVGVSIAASYLQYNTESAIFFWDGASPAYSYKVPIDDNYIAQAYNKNGEIYLVTQGKSVGASLFRVSENSLGASKVASFKFDMGGTLMSFYMVGVGAGGGFYARNNRYNMDVFQNRLLIGMTSQSAAVNKNLIFAYGSPDEGIENAFFQPFSTPDADANYGNMGMVKQVSTGEIYIGFNNNSVYSLYSLSSGYSTTANYKGVYTDFGQKIRINYIKAYFDPLVSGDSITLGLDVDYGKKSLNLGRGAGNISYGNDAAITSKRFDIKELCHSFRPTVNWISGGAAISKIVVDYDFVDDL